MARAESYVQTADSLIANLPADAVLRPDIEQQLEGLANGQRQKKGVRGLVLSADFQKAARAQAIDMMTHDFVGHRSSTGQDFDSRMRAFMGKVMFMPKMAENAARESKAGPVDDAKVMRLFQQWVNSNGHRKAMLNSGYAFVSTGVVQRGHKIYAVQIFWAKGGDAGILGSKGKSKSEGTAKSDSGGLY